MSMKKAIERLEAEIEDVKYNLHTCNEEEKVTENSYMLGLKWANRMLVREAKPPCRRCKHWKLQKSYVGLEDYMDCSMLAWDAPVCKHYKDCPDDFEPKEEDYGE